MKLPTRLAQVAAMLIAYGLVACFPALPSKPPAGDGGDTSSQDQSLSVSEETDAKPVTEEASAEDGFKAMAKYIMGGEGSDEEKENKLRSLADDYLFYPNTFDPKNANHLKAFLNFYYHSHPLLSEVANNSFLVPDNLIFFIRTHEDPLTESEIDLLAFNLKLLGSSARSFRSSVQLISHFFGFEFPFANCNDGDCGIPYDQALKMYEDVLLNKFDGETSSARLELLRQVNDLMGINFASGEEGLFQIQLGPKDGKMEFTLTPSGEGPFPPAEVEGVEEVSPGTGEGPGLVPVGDSGLDLLP